MQNFLNPINTIKNSYFSKASTSYNENIVSENEEKFEIRKSKRIRKKKSFGHDFLTYFIGETTSSPYELPGVGHLPP
jgi:hypothetical protein